MPRTKETYTSRELAEYATEKLVEYCELVKKGDTPMISTTSEDAFMDSFVEHFRDWLDGKAGRKVAGYKLRNGVKEYIYE